MKLEELQEMLLKRSLGLPSDSNVTFANLVEMRAKLNQLGPRVYGATVTREVYEALKAHPDFKKAMGGFASMLYSTFYLAVDSKQTEACLKFFSRAEWDQYVNRYEPSSCEVHEIPL